MIDDDIVDYIAWLYPDDAVGGRIFNSFYDLWNAMMHDEFLPRWLG